MSGRLEEPKDSRDHYHKSDWGDKGGQWWYPNPGKKVTSAVAGAGRLPPVAHPELEGYLPGQSLLGALARLFLRCAL